MDENDPVDEDEYVYRRLPRAFYDASLPIPVQGLAFRPSNSDTTGLSVFRARFAHPLDTLTAIDPAKANDYYVARIAVSALRNLGLAVEPDPIIGGPLGHAIIPELSWPAYQSRKNDLKVVLVELAKLASADIAHRPA